MLFLLALYISDQNCGPRQFPVGSDGSAGSCARQFALLFSLALKPGPDSEARFRIPAARASGLPLSIADRAGAGAITRPREFG